MDTGETFSVMEHSHFHGGFTMASRWKGGALAVGSSSSKSNEGGAADQEQWSKQQKCLLFVSQPFVFLLQNKSSNFFLSKQFWASDFAWNGCGRLGLEIVQFAQKISDEIKIWFQFYSHFLIQWCSHKILLREPSGFCENHSQLPLEKHLRSPGFPACPWSREQKLPAGRLCACWSVDWGTWFQAAICKKTTLVFLCFFSAKSSLVWHEMETFLRLEMALKPCNICVVKTIRTPPDGLIQLSSHVYPCVGIELISPKVTSTQTIDINIPIYMYKKDIERTCRNRSVL